MFSLVRSSLFRLIALLVVLLPLSILVSRVYVPYSRSSKHFTFGLSLVQPACSSEFPPVRKFSISRGTGQGLYDLSVQSGIDDAYALAVFEKESSFGRYGAGFDDHALGNIVCAGYPTCNGRFRWYPSWITGYEDFYQLVSREYVARGLSTIEAITPVYAPSSENDTGLYIQQVRQSMLAFRQAQSLML